MPFGAYSFMGFFSILSHNLVSKGWNFMKLCSPCCRFIPVCYEREFIMSLSDDKQADIIDAFNTTSNLDDILKKH